MKEELQAGDLVFDCWGRPVGVVSIIDDDTFQVRRHGVVVLGDQIPVTQAPGVPLSGRTVEVIGNHVVVDLGTTKS